MIVEHLFIAIGLYGIIMLLVSMKHLLHVSVFKDFILDGDQNGSIVIMLSLLATIMVGSSTLCLFNISLTKRFAIFWWLAIGSLVLTLNAIFFAEKLHKLKAYTLPHVAYIFMEKEARFFIS